MTRHPGAFSAALHAALLLAGCSDPAALRPARWATPAVAPQGPSVIERATAALTDLEETATSRSLRSKALLKRAHQAECDGHFNEARDLYNTAAELDARNTAAAEGKHRMMWLLGEPPFDGPELIINPGRFEARFAFNEAVEQADLALAQRPPRIDAAWVHFERARAVVVQSAEVVTPET